MATPLHVPRVNNNDDSVSVVSIDVKAGDSVKRGQVVGSVETDKAVVDVEASCDGYVLQVRHQPQEKADVGAVLMWLGATHDEPVPEEMVGDVRTKGNDGRPTAKAKAMLRDLGLEEGLIPASGDRLTVADIEAWLANQGRSRTATRPDRPSTEESIPQVPGEFHALSPEAHGMLTTVLWHRDQAVHGYLEMEYDPKPWEDYATRYAQQHRLMLSPLTALMAYRLVELAKSSPHINSTIVHGKQYQYSPVNLGFTVQAGRTLYLIVVQDAQSLDAASFIEAMSRRQRNAMLHKLQFAELSGATISFSSMARWNVSRHVPVLPPYTGLIVAHAAPRNSGKAVLGASYDHRLLTGHDIIQVLQALSQPPH